MLLFDYVFIIVFHLHFSDITEINSLLRKKGEKKVTKRTYIYAKCTMQKARTKSHAEN